MANLNVKVDVLNGYLLKSPIVFVQHKVGDIISDTEAQY